MQVKNNYDMFLGEPATTGEKDLGVFNGDIGTIVEVDAGGITVSFDGRLAAYPPELLGELEPAYAVYGAQGPGQRVPGGDSGAERRAPLPAGPGVLYTAITAPGSCSFGGDGELMARMVANDRQMRRYSACAPRLLRETGTGGVTNGKREQKIQAWFGNVAPTVGGGIEDVFDSNAVYIESWGPEYPRAGEDTPLVSGVEQPGRGGALGYPAVFPPGGPDRGGVGL